MRREHCTRTSRTPQRPGDRDAAINIVPTIRRRRLWRADGRPTYLVVDEEGVTGESIASIRLSAMILGLLDVLLAELVFPGSTHAGFQSPVARKLERLLSAPDAATLSLNRLAHRAGYQHDYLNRVLKRHDGLTLGQLRARRLLARSQQLLRQTDPVADVAEAMGFSDPKYFARSKTTRDSHSTRPVASL